MPPIRADALSSVRLKPTTTVDKSYPDVSARAIENDFLQDAHEKNFLDVGMEHWLPHVANLTFATVTMPLMLEEAKIIRRCYSHLHAGDVAASWAVATSDTTTATTLPQELIAQLVTIGVRLRPIVNALVEKKGAVFAKLSGRSAKDAPLYTSKLDVAFQANLQATKGTADKGTKQDNAQLMCLFDAALSLAKVKDVGHLLWNLINSHRVDEDLDVAIRHPERWDQAIIVREWWEGVTSDLEFRLFVVNGMPTGLTQYNHLIYSERCACHGEKIALALRSFYVRNVQPRLKGTTFYSEVAGRFTCDFALTPDALTLLDDEHLPELTSEHVQLVELNAFYEATGMGLFDYYGDQEQLMNGPFEWRMRTEPLPQAAVKLENEWRRLLKPVPDARRTTDEAWAAIDAALAVV